MGLTEAVVLIIVQLLLHRFPMGGDALCTQEIAVRMDDCPELMAAFENLIAKRNGSVIRSNIRKDSGMIDMEVVVRLATPITYKEALDFSSAYPGITQVAV